MDPYLQEFFAHNKFVMAILCFWPFSSSYRKEILYNIVGYIYVVINILVVLADAYNLISNLDDIFAFVEGVCDITMSLIGLLKGLILINKRIYFREIFTLMDDLYVNIPVDERPEHIKILDSAYVNQAKFIVKGMTFTYFCPMTFYCANPWWILLRTGEFTFPFPTKYPFDTNEWHSFLPMYTLEFVMGYGLLVCLISMETLFSSWILFLCSRVDTLEYSIEIATNEAINNGGRTPTFGKCVVYHNKILRACELIQELFGVYLVFQFFMSMVMICLLLFLSTQTNLLDSKTPIFTSYLASVIIQLFIYCYFGQKLQNRCVELFEEGFYTNWYDAPVTYQKDIKFYLFRSRKPVILTAVKLMPVNLESFFIIMKNSMSYFTILLSMKDEQEL